MDTKEIMKQENLKPLEADLVVMESMMEAIIDELEFLKQREARMRDTNGKPG